MKRLLYLLCFITITSQAQIVNIPDANFKAALIDRNVDINSDGEIQESEALAVTDLFVANSNISDLTGISSFINLSILDCRNNALTSLDVSGLTNLWELDCSNNNLTTLNVSGLDTLWSLVCDDNQLTSLDVSELDDLISLWCSNNQLTELNFTNCPNLSDILSGHNNLTSLDFTGVDSYTSSNFQFPYNSISSMVFPSGYEIGSLTLDNNQIIDLDLSNVVSLNNIFLFGNPIETINIKNGVSDFNNISSYTFNVQFICADEFELAEINNDYNVMTYGILVSEYCNFEPGGAYNRLTGSIRLDLDNDGCDASDSVLSNVLLEINDGTDQNYVSTNQLGDYSSYVGLGDFSITPNFENPDWFNTIPNASNTLLIDFGNDVVQDFCMSPNGVRNDLEIIVSSIIDAQPGFNATYDIVYKNKGNQMASGDIEFIFDDAVLDFVSSSEAVSNQNTGSLVWNYTNLNPFESRHISVTLNVNSPMETPAVNIGDQLDFQATINPTSSDETPNDNVFNYEEEVVGSYDPNDITCLEGDIVSPDMIGEYLHYNIRFENTGTAAATFVVVANEINEAQYDLSSLQILNASHEMTSRMVGNKIEFIFDNINLAPEARGNVTYKIKSLNNLTTGDSVSNNANIFFDYNFPIETNTATTTFNTLSVAEFTQENSVSVYPNPTKGQLFINSIYDIKNVVLYDIQGRKVQGLNSLEISTLDISNVSKGVYFLELTSVKGIATIKIIKD